MPGIAPQKPAGKICMYSGIGYHSMLRNQIPEAVVSVVKKRISV